VKTLFFLFCLLALPASAQPRLVSVLFKGRVETYWLLYESPDGKYTKVSNASSGIDFFMETKYLNSITVATHGKSGRLGRIRKQ